MRNKGEKGKNEIPWRDEEKDRMEREREIEVYLRILWRAGCKSERIGENNLDKSSVSRRCSSWRTTTGPRDLLVLGRVETVIEGRWIRERELYRIKSPLAFH